jgi:hypothetical protein
VLWTPFLLLSHTVKCVSEPTYFNPEDEGRMFLQNIGIDQQNYTVSQPRRQHS